MRIGIGKNENKRREEWDGEQWRMRMREKKMRCRKGKDENKGREEWR